MRSGTRLVEGVLWLVAAASSVWALLWVLGTNGLQWIGAGSVPQWLEHGDRYGVTSWTGSPTTRVEVQPPAVNDILAGYSNLNSGVPGEAPQGFAELYAGSFISLLTPSSTQRFWYLVAEVLVFVAIAAIAGTLARMVASARSESPFTQANVRRLRFIGVLLLVGAPLASLTEWLCLKSMVGSSTLAEQVQTPDYRFIDVPLWTMAVGAAVLVLAAVWRRGVRMAYDVQGLV